MSKKKVMQIVTICLVTVSAVGTGIFFMGKSSSSKKGDGTEKLVVTNEKVVASADKLDAAAIDATDQALKEQLAKMGEEDLEKAKEEYPNWIEGLDIREYIKQFLEQFDNYGIIDIDESNVYIREKPGTDSKKVGIISNEGFVEILGEDTDSEGNKWYKVSSGDVTGYIRADLVTTGDDAKALIEKKGTLLVEMKEKDASLNVRASESTDSEIINKIVPGEGVIVKSATDEWVRVEVVAGEEGYVSREYAKFVYNLKMASEIDKSIDVSNNDKNNGKNNGKNGSSSNGGSDNSEGETVSGSGSGSAVVAYALQFQGNSYVSGGEKPGAFDCSGLVRYVYKQVCGVSLPHSSKSQRSCGKTVSTSALQPGDLVFTTGHVAIYAGGGNIVEAANPSVGVVHRKMWFTPQTAVRIVE